jgi:hypothetical protein
MYISRISFENIRGFHELEIDLWQGNQLPNLMTLVIGKNGTCKSTLLRAIVIGLCYEPDAYALLSEPIGGLVTEEKWEARIEIDLVSPKDPGKFVTVITEIQRQRDDREIIVQSGDQGDRDEILGALPERLFLCGYGAGRSVVGTDVGRPYRIADSAYSLFDYQQTLIDPELTLRRLSGFLGTEVYGKALRGLKRVLDLSDQDEINPRKGGGIEVTGNLIGQHIPFQAWADGYRVTLDWLLDLYAWAIRADKISSSGEIRGIVLIDELEQHLHPSLQIEMPSRLKEAFPEVQFFATTHSPHVILGAFPQEVVSLSRKGDVVAKEEHIPDFSGYSAEDILVDERLFDTSAYSPETNEKLERYRELASIPEGKREPDQVEELRTLATELRTQQIPEVRQPTFDPELKRILQKYDL